MEKQHGKCKETRQDTVRTISNVAANEHAGDSSALLEGRSLALAFLFNAVKPVSQTNFAAKVTK